ncbi:hypothetical protein [Mesorhizobium sophorae]|uniref:hypothetical protein n=1 Tax=Mesorhizobium sophorae TaxID=1300294 RepID=UPI000BA3DA4D|nr:hypothetical protein [Mesorhizobium sophorae]
MSARVKIRKQRWRRERAVSGYTAGRMRDRETSSLLDLVATPLAAGGVEWDVVAADVLRHGWAPTLRSAKSAAEAAAATILKASCH